MAGRFTSSRSFEFPDENGNFVPLPTMFQKWQAEGQKDGPIMIMMTQLDALGAKRDMEGMVIMAREAAKFCREVKHKEGLLNFLDAESRALIHLGCLDDAMSCLTELEPLLREQNKKDALAENLANQGGIHGDRGDLNEALALYKESEAICREIGNQDYLPSVLYNQSRILEIKGDNHAAAALRREAKIVTSSLKQIFKGLFGGR